MTFAMSRNSLRWIDILMVWSITLTCIHLVGADHKDVGFISALTVDPADIQQKVGFKPQIAQVTVDSSVFILLVWFTCSICCLFGRAKYVVTPSDQDDSLGSRVCRIVCPVCSLCMSPDC
ncbi:unnamed protein product [Dicrocoelium dendriticum]|nr:unnamed protein product [Dicrocoelium dendriticum]